MYCPNCGSNNQADLNYCARCGTNLAVVANALGDKADALPADETLVKMLKDYYTGRHSVFVGAPLFILSIILLTIFFIANFQDTMPPIMLIPLAGAIYGGISAFSGLSRWVETSSEMKAIGYEIPQKLSSRRARERIATTSDTVTGVARSYATDPIALPGSVTEQTTRRLDHTASEPNSGSQPNKTSQ